MLKKPLLKKNVIFEKELDCINRDEIGSLEDSPRLLFIDEECENLVVVNDGEERTGNISQKKVRCFTIAYRCPLSDKCCTREYFFSNQWNIYWESVR